MTEELPSFHNQDLDLIYRLVDEIKADEIRAAQGIKTARTRVRVKLSRVAGLCRAVRKSVPSVSARPYWIGR